MKPTHIMIHYSEIGIKKDNRSFFEDILVRNINDSCKDYIVKTFKRYGRVVCVLNTSVNTEEIKVILSSIPGISSFSFCFSTNQNLENIKVLSFDLSKFHEKDFENFRVTSTRSFKKFPLTSQELDRQVGEVIFENLRKKVKLKNPDFEINIEVTEKEVFIFSSKDTTQGVSGLPVGSTGNVMCSLSGGIDSPVSGFMLNKRGCKVIYAHIQSNNLVTKEVEEKIFKLCNTLRKFQGRTKLIVIPFSDIQTKLLMLVPADHRMIIYRRFMLRIIQELAIKENAQAIVTGDSVGQVASQTLENISCIYEATTLPVFPPLIGFNKEEIITIAKKIGTYDISIIPYPDCCSFMVAEHPQTRARIEEVKAIEDHIPDKEQLVKDAILKSKEYFF
ncbi:MAG: tRNA uracil 4-sulfurtransferase ThiI [archaeon]|jgi:thiamine biosynthesis protein ThiI